MVLESLSERLHQLAFAEQTIHVDDGLHDGKDPLAGGVGESFHEAAIRRNMLRIVLVYLFCLKVQQSGDRDHGIAQAFRARIGLIILGIALDDPQDFSGESKFMFLREVAIWMAIWTGI